MLNGADLMVIRLSLKKIIVAVAVIAAAVIICVTAALNFSAVDVCIDPGHGGYDSGAEFSGRNEKDDNLAVALLVRDELEKAGIRTCITRDEDEFISLSKRCRIANRHRAKLFVSLHRNSADNAKGIEIWIHSDAPEQDSALAQNILDELDGAGISLNRGVKSGFAREDGENYYVNSNTNMPSCLVELGFINSEEDNDLLDKNMEKYAAAIARGIEETLREMQ